MERKELTILCVGGKAIETPESLRKLIKDFVKIKGRKIMVHGGGDMVTTIADKLGVKPKRAADGEPVVDRKWLDVSTMVHGGLTGSHLVSLLQWHGTTALSLTGIDLALLTAARHAPEGVDRGSLGKVKKVNAAMLNTLLEAGVVPVIAPIATDGRGGSLYVDEDDVAAEVARALAPTHEITLVYCTDRNGVLMNEQDPDSVIAVLRRTQYRNLREMDIIKGGMVPKIDSAFSSIDHGVSRVLITSVENLGRTDAGTLIG